MSITLGYDRTQYFTGIWIKGSRWNGKTNKVKGRDQESITMNDTLLSLQSLGRQVTNELIMSGKPFNSKTIKNKMKNGFTSNLGVINRFDNFLLRMEQQIPSKYTRSTLIKYTNTKNRIQEFIKKSTQRNDSIRYPNFWIPTEQEKQRWFRMRAVSSKKLINQLFPYFLMQELLTFKICAMLKERLNTGN